MKLNLKVYKQSIILIVETKRAINKVNETISFNNVKKVLLKILYERDKNRYYYIILKSIIELV